MKSARLEKVTKRFGSVLAVDSVTLDIAAGELFFLLGPSGCGKTTLLRLIAGFYKPDEGRIFFDDRDVTTVPPHKRNAAMVFQNYALFPHMTAWENVEYGLNVRGIHKDEKKQRVSWTLALVHMTEYDRHFPGQLSGGQQQRIALARALVVQPDLLLLDEPLSNLDAKLRHEMRTEIRDIQKQLGITTIYVTHDQKEALAIADRIAVMRDGRIEQIGTPKELYRKPKNRWVAEFIGEINLFAAMVKCVQDNRLEVETSFGTFACSHPGHWSPATGHQILCALRPEAIHISRQSPVASRQETSLGHWSLFTGRPNSFFARVVDLVYLGEVELCEFSLAEGITFKATITNPREVNLKRGDEVSLSFDPEDVIVLPPD